MKNRPRKWKDDLIVTMNSEWEDLSESIGVTPLIVEEVRAVLVEVQAAENSTSKVDPPGGRRMDFGEFS